MKHKLLAYILRWQLSTPILALCMWLLPSNIIIKTILANLIGALVFFNIDKYIFTNKKQKEIEI
ncbi:MAG: hypothetical protein ACOCUI_02890 [bacterium]